MRERYNANRVINLHCGMGRDSLTMVCLALEGRLSVDGLGDDVSLSDLDSVLFSDTGREWPHTYDLIESVRQTVEKGGSELVVLRKGGPFHYRPDILEDFRSRSTVVSLSKGDCTDNHKIQPMRRFMSSQHRLRFGVKDNAARGRQVRAGEADPSLVLIGIAADETARLEGDHKRPSYVDERYPLVYMGITKSDEAAILERHGLNHVRKSGCHMCPYQPAGWWWALRETEPELFEESCQYERTALARNPRMNVSGVRRGGKKGRLVLLPELVDRWRELNPAATVDAVLDKQYSRCRAEARAMKKSESEGMDGA